MLAYGTFLWQHLPALSRAPCTQPHAPSWTRRITLLLAVLATEVWTQNPPPGFVTTECLGNLMMIMLDKSFLVGKHFRIDIIAELSMGAECVSR
ncbi:UNVERIFIED_CONTAM: hypothetical protein FKN15_028556 [Acipenser sinensis]